MSSKPTAAPKPAPDPFKSLKKGWTRTLPLRKVLAWAFILHGSIRLTTDFWNMREPFILADVDEWWQWLTERWAQVRGVKVQVES